MTAYAGSLSTYWAALNAYHLPFESFDFVFETLLIYRNLLQPKRNHPGLGSTLNQQL